MFTDKVFNSPYEIYVDPTRAIYRALGMTRRTTDGGSEDDKGEYVVHGPVGGIGLVVRNALKMPLGKAGDIKQLGGEFLFGPGIRSDFCHRMPTTRAHTSIRELLKLAKVDMSGYKTLPKKAGGLATVPLALGDTGAPLSSSMKMAVPSYFLPPQLDVQVDDDSVRRRKNSWDDFLQWTQERRIGTDAQEAQGNEAYPWAAADQEVWGEHGGFCALDDDGTATSCSRSFIEDQGPTTLRPAAARKVARDARVLTSWGIPA